MECFSHSLVVFINISGTVRYFLLKLWDFHVKGDFDIEVVSIDHSFLPWQPRFQTVLRYH